MHTTHFFPIETPRGSPTITKPEPENHTIFREASMQTTHTSHPRNICHVLAGLCTFALIPAVGTGCNLAASIEALDTAEGTDDQEDEDLVPVKPKRTCVELVAAQTIRAGTVCMSIEPQGVMHVLYTTTDGWELIEAQLAAGDSMSDVPVDDEGNPVIGQFAFDSGDITGATSHAFVVPLLNFHFNADFEDVAESCDSVTAYLAAHAVLRKRKEDGTWQTESGWGHREGIIDSGNWATFFNMSLECDAPESPQLDACEISFAKGSTSTCFIGADFDGDELDDGIEHWGWTNGPIAPGTGAAWPVYAVAGQCNVARATRVGSLSVSYGRDGNAQIVFDSVGDFVLDEEHLHVGTEPLPRDGADRLTIAPGRYPIVHELDDATHTENLVSGLEGDIYVAYHAVACVDDPSSGRRAAR
jgi:hypothetical protein